MIFLQKLSFLFFLTYCVPSLMACDKEELCRPESPQFVQGSYAQIINDYRNLRLLIDNELFAVKEGLKGMPSMEMAYLQMIKSHTDQKVLQGVYNELFKSFDRPVAGLRKIQDSIQLAIKKHEEAVSRIPLPQPKL